MNEDERKEFDKRDRSSFWYEECLAARSDLVAALARVEGLEAAMTALAGEYEHDAEVSRGHGLPTSTRRAFIYTSCAKNIRRLLDAPLPSVDGTGDRK